ncbi:MAG: threonine--tRNA ligase, partial [Christensenellales bacterium]
MWTESLGLNEILDKGGSFKVLTFKDEEGKEVYRHTASHVLAQAIKRLYPDAKLAIGPAVKTGFYYDIDFSRPITLDDFKAIEEEMNKIVKSDFAVEKSVVSVERAKEMLADEPYKLELLEGIKDETVTFFTQGEFSDMCRGPHLSSTGKLKAFRLTSIAGAYWRGDSSKKMLTRIYGTAFDKKSEMEEFLARVEEAKKRDHNKLGRELGIFMTEENIGQGLPLFMPKGAHILKTMQRWVEDEEEKRGYMITKTPFMAKSDLYKISGHWYHYRDAMFILGNPEEADVNKEVLALRPMTCPFQFMIYKNGLKSYRDLPVRYNETATLFRNENSGEMHGMIRVRQFTLSDGHIICRPDQIEQEFLGVLDLIRYFMKTLGLENDVSYRFSRWDPENKEKYIDNPEAWENSERLMKKILDDAGVNYYEAVGEAAFYGPKLDVQSVNVYGKEDTLFTIQIDFELAERFDMSYVDADGNKK